jgi:hypothetical protein
MVRWFFIFLAALACATALSGCSAGQNPANPASELKPALSAPPGSSHESNTYLWGWYDVSIDTETGEVIALCDRQCMFTANVVNFLNMSPANIIFQLNEIDFAADWVDVNIDVTLRHPFPGLVQFNGYDVRGVFMGDGSAVMEYNSDLVYPVDGTDQYMVGNPDFPNSENGSPDGYTRWFNISEFGNPSMPLFGYTQGNYASKNFNGTATLNPYKYYADSLGTKDDLEVFLANTAHMNGVFSSGAANTRNYFIRFPNAKGVVFAYAVTANWEGPLEENHPSNAPETVAVDVDENGDVYYVDSSTNGGTMKLDISVWDWGVESAGVGDYRIIVESTVLSSPHIFDAAKMTPTGGNENFSTYHAEIPADNVTHLEDNEYWVIVECENFDYSNPYDVMNDAWDDPLAAFFRFDLHVSDTPPENPPDWKNIPLRDDAKPWDIAIDPVSGRILIVYSDVTAWQYLLSDNYQFPNPDGTYYDTQWYLLDPWPGHTFYVDKAFIDCMENGCFALDFTWNPNYWVDRAWLDIVDDNGNQVIRHSPNGEWPWSYPSSEVMAWGEDGIYPNDAAQLWGNSVPGYRSYVSKATSSSNYSFLYDFRNYYSAGAQQGITNLVAAWVKGAEVDADDETFWALEGPTDYYCARWYLNAVAGDTQIFYDNAYFGTGAQTDSDSGFYNPKDLTRDSNGNMMALDILSDGTPRIKAWDVSGTPVSLGGLDLTEIIGPPIKFDCSDFEHPQYGNLLCIIHGDDTDGYFLSIYFEDEIPW